jgi:hypothetical protein
MKRFLLSLLLIISISGFSQVGTFTTITIKGKPIDTLRQDTIVLQGAGRSIVTAKAIYDFVVGRLGNLASYNIRHKSVLINRDTTELFHLDTTQTSTANGWRQSVSYGTYVTETVVAGSGLKVRSTYTGSYDTSKTQSYNAGWESAINDASATMTLTLDTIGSTLPYIGIFFRGCTDLSPSDLHVRLNPLTSTFYVKARNYAAETSETIPFSFSQGDEIKITLRRQNHLYLYEVTNITRGKYWQSSQWHQASISPLIGNIYPGWYIQDGTITIKEYKYYGHNYHPDLLVLGSSISTNQTEYISRPAYYDSSVFGRLAQISDLAIINASKCANKLQDMISALPEVIKMKPKHVLIEGGHNNLFAGEAVGIWQPLYHALVDSLKAAGIQVIVERLIPSSSVDETIVNAFVDSAFVKDKNINVVNLYNTTPLYNVDSSGFQNPTYYSDGVHLNSIGSKEVAYYLRNQLQTILSPKMGEVNDVTMSEKDVHVLIYDSVTHKYNTYRLGKNIFKIQGDSLTVADTLYTKRIYATDTVFVKHFRFTSGVADVSGAGGSFSLIDNGSTTWANGQFDRNGFVRFQLRNANAGINAGVGFYLLNDISTTFQFAKYSSTASIGANLMRLYNVLGDVQILNDAGHIRLETVAGYSTKITQLNLSASFTPTGTADATGIVGDVARDDNYMYVKTSAGWKRSALSTF